MTVVRKGITDLNGLTSGFGIVLVGANDSPTATPIALVPTDRQIYTTAALTGTQAIQLPLANSVEIGTRVDMVDLAGGATNVNTVTGVKQVGSGDTVRGTAVINAAYGKVSFRSDGTANWVSV